MVCRSLIARGLLAQLAQILAADSSRQLSDDFFQRAVFHHQLEVHFRLAAQTIDRLQEGFAIGPDGAAQSFIRIKNSAEAERKNRERAETLAHHAGVINDGFLG